MAEIRVERIHYGFLVAPEGSRDAGQPIPVVGYVVRHPDGLFLPENLTQSGSAGDVVLRRRARIRLDLRSAARGPSRPSRAGR
jgi:hypothetical protein